MEFQLIGAYRDDGNGVTLLMKGGNCDEAEKWLAGHGIVLPRQIAPGHSPPGTNHNRTDGQDNPPRLGLWRRCYKFCGKCYWCAEKFRLFIEIASFLAVIISVPFVIAEYKASVQRDQEATAEKIYRDVDERYVDYLKIAMDHPELDGYSVPLTPPPKLTADQQLRQKMLYTNLTDVFEVAYVQYFKTKTVDEAIRSRLFDKQWPGWENYIKKFLARPAYRQVWHEVRDEYDEDFAKYMDHLSEPSSKPAG